MLLQQVAQAVAPAAESGPHPLAGTAARFLWLLPLLPLLGFVINGLLSLLPAFHAGPADPSAEGHDDPHAPGPVAAHDSAAEQDLPGHHDHGDDHHAVARHRYAGLVSIVGPAVLAATFVLAVMMFLAMRGLGQMEAPYVARYFEWIRAGGLYIPFALQLDQLSMVMVLVITGVGTLIHIFSVGYMQDDPGYPRYFSYLNLFVFFMLLLVLGANYPIMFIGWEGVGLCSYLLIGFWFSEKANADAGKKAFIVNRIGDFGFLVAMFLLFANLHTLSFTSIGARAGDLGYGSALVTTICLFLFLGCAGKSAQIPLYVWLPDAMAGPTPVSALIHAATMVTAGVYLVARSAMLFSMAPVASLTVALVGALTAIFAATIGLKQWDIKKVLAYSTVSQLGYMFVGVGVGAYTAGVFHLVTHAFFKALLFLGSGSVIFAMHRAYHATHSADDAQDMRNMGGLARYMPVTHILMWIATLAISGVPFFSGFYSKDEILGSVFVRAHESTLAEAHWLGIPGRPLLYAIYVIGLAAAFITAVYMTRMMIYTFLGTNRTGDAERPHLAEAPWVMTGPLVVLGALSLFGGMFNLPEVFPFNYFGLAPEGALHHWLEPVVGRPSLLITGGSEAHVEHGTELALIGAAVAVGVLGIVTALVRLRRGERLVPKARSPEEVGFQRVLLNKYFVDEAYDRALVRPTYNLSRNVLWRGVDVGIIDALVNAAAKISRGVGGIGSSLQSGQVGTYAWVLLVGVLAVLGAFTLRS
ncbi:MAG TPA: NADH-quinone oxidoreductase subunit L [Gemmatimonadaceae bacterium]|nr:NADH-quinone oxidoreductase subunit L [Gemmatimonadaceae bacterium]